MWNYDSKPHIFVKSEWLEHLHLRPYTAFAMIDAIGVKTALAGGRLTGSGLIRLRDEIDKIAAETPGMAFVSLADSLIVKANWYVGHYDSDVNYSYEPESLVRIFPRISKAYEEAVGLKIYAVITQGVNEYEDDALVHVSEAGAHISLNSLGLPFAQLLSIDEAAREAIKSKGLAPSDLYLDSRFYHSLRFQHDFEKHAEPHMAYNAPMSSTPGTYYAINIDTALSNLRAED